MRPMCQRRLEPRATSSLLHFLGDSRVPVHQLDIAGERPQLFYVAGAQVPLLIQHKELAHFYQYLLAHQVKQFQLHYQVIGLARFSVRHFCRAHQMLRDLRGLNATVYQASLERVHYLSLMKELHRYEPANL